MHLHMIRHGQSFVNLKDWTEGNVDAGLTDLGKRQAAALGDWLPTYLPEIDVLYASTMARARETAEEVSRAYDNIPITYDDRMREVGNNRFDHTPWPNEDLPKVYAEYWSSSRPFSPVMLRDDMGESFMHFRTRVGLFIEEMTERHQGQTVVVVCHGGVVEAAFDHIFNIGPWRRCEVWDRNTALTHFEYVQLPTREVWRLHSHNRVEHLIGIE